MVIHSVQFKESDLIELEIEVTLIPGLPRIEVIGCLDSEVRESALRVRSALRNCGYRFPRARGILFDVAPRGIKKTASGLDLALALGTLAITDQWKPTSQVQERQLGDFAIVGDVTLSGEVSAPKDLDVYIKQSARPILSGHLGSCHLQHRAESGLETFLSPYFALSHLQLPSISFFQTDRVEGAVAESLAEQEPNELTQLRFTEEQSDLALTLALGHHSALLAGPAGSGKSTFAKVVRELRKLTDPTTPFIDVHHTSGERALIGGGVPIRAGAVSRAHDGILFLDELLLFRPEVQEALREPMEEGRVLVARSFLQKTFDTRFQLLAATNLCPCGGWTPTSPERCVCSSRRRDRYLERWRGPFIDRFEILVMTDRWDREEANVTWRELAKRYRSAVRSAQGDAAEVMTDIGQINHSNLSRRRERAYQRVLATFVRILDQQGDQLKPALSALERAERRTFQWTVEAFALLNQS